jgi:GH35 family endo-1,4-beta-xylanase
MKHYSKILFLAAAFTGLVSCAVNELKEFPVEQPANLAAYEYLKEYEVLKNYVDRTASPDFKLGAGVTAGAFVNHGQEYLMSVSNFDEVTPRTEMNHAAIVDNNGRMSFDAVKDFVKDANGAGISVYGNALAWNQQQNNKFLNTLIADRIDPNYVPELVPVEKYIDRTCIEVVSQDMVSAAWDTQFWIMCPTEFKEGDAWEVSMDIYALTEAAPGTQVHKATPGDYLHWSAIGNPAFKTEWSTWTNSGTMPAEAAGGYSIAFNLNDLATGNTWYLDNISFKLNGVEQVVNGSCDDPEATESFFSKEYPAPNPSPSRIVTKYKKIDMVEIPKTQDVARTCVVVESDNMVDAAWDTQFWIYFPDSPMAEGDSWEVSMDVRADKESYAGTQTHVGPGGYIHWAAIGNVTFTTEWETYTARGTVDSSMKTGDAIAFNLNDFQEANKYYFDNISFKLNGVEVIANGSCDDLKGNANFIAKEKRGATVGATIVDHYTIELPGGRTPQTPEEMKDTLTTAMDKWIKGAMNATAGTVKAWDAVKDLYAERVDDGSRFYWQDYIGEDDYVKMAFSKARAYYAEADVDGDGVADGNNPSELKLFISEGGLENADKLAALVAKVKAWETDPNVQIDGIAVQLYVNYILDADAQTAQETAIAAMFAKLAETGKLIKVSELNIGVAETAGGAELAPAAVTEEQHHAAADFYKFVVGKYLETIPAAQQYGITKWNTSDTTTSASGLWDANYGRKHTYAGFAAGLQGE